MTRVANVGGRQYRGGLPDPALILVGRITLAGAELENCLTDLIAALVSPPIGSGPVRFLIHHDPMQLKLNRLKLITEANMSWGGQELGLSPARAAVSDEIRERVRAFVRSANMASDLRNKVVHSDWWTAQDDDDQFLQRSTTSRTKVVLADVPATVIDLKATLALLLVVIEECYSLLSDVLSYWFDQQPQGDESGAVDAGGAPA